MSFQSQLSIHTALQQASERLISTETVHKKIDLMSESGLLPEVTHGADGVKPNYIEGHFCK